MFRARSLRPDAESSFVPSYSGVVDADGDGLDDDGRVDLRVRDGHACITISEGIARVEESRC